MKKLTKFLCVTALVFAVIGFAFCIASLCFGFGSGELQQMRAEGSSRLREAGDLLRQGTDGRWVQSEESDFHQSYSGITSLKIDASAAECLLLLHDEDTVQVTGYGLPSGFSCKRSASSLSVKASEGVFPFAGILGFHVNAPVLEICIPRDLVLENLKIDAGVGEVTMKDGMLSCREAEIECGVGSCILALDVSEKLDLECGVGELDLVLAGEKEDYNYRLECGIGSISIENDEYSSIGENQRLDYGADRDVSAECGIGSVSIRFR